MVVEIETDKVVGVTTSDVLLEGQLSVPSDSAGIVLFAHGSGSSRHSPRNRFVAHKLQERGLATLLIDLLTEEEEEVDRLTREYRFNIPMLAKRLVGAVDWLHRQPETSALQIGLFGSSTGAGAALIAAHETPSHVGAVVSRGGRPDLADKALSHVQTPTLLIVGGKDAQVIELNQQAMEQMPSTVDLEVIPGASHLFQESGTLEVVAQLAGDWFTKYLKHPTTSPAS